MTYQAFSNCNPSNINDEGCTRDFRITIPENMYITQDDIYFNIYYENINYDKINKLYNDLHDNCINEIEGYKCSLENTDGMKVAQKKINEIFDSTIKTMKNEYKLALERQTPLFMFQNIELFVNGVSIAWRRLSGLDDLIIDNKLPLTQIFPGLKFKYNHEKQLIIRFQRTSLKNQCLKFECYYDLHSFNNEEEKKEIKGGYKEYIIPGGFYTGNIQIEPDVKSFKMVPCVGFMLYKKFENKDYKKEAENMINEYYNKMKLKYYKDGLEISETEFGNSPGLYHIELLNKDDFKNKADFYRIDYKIICLC